MKKRSRAQRTTVPEQQGVGAVIWRTFRQFVRENTDAALLTLAIFHLIFFLVILGGFAQSGRKGPRAFGMSEPREEQKAETKPQVKAPAVSAVSVAFYGAYTILLWSIVMMSRKRFKHQLFRFTMIMLAPGTLLWLFSIGYLVVRRNS